jgi:sugar-specific transcriptional regulator TrmB
LGQLRKSERVNLSQNRIAKLLNALGFSNIDAKIYIYIAKLGPLSNEEIARRLEIAVEKLNPILEELVKKRVISPILKNQLVYNALSFEELLDNLIKSETVQAEEITKNHQQLVAIWKKWSK